MQYENSESPFQRNWKQFRKNRPAIFGLGVICLALLVSILGGLIRPDSTTNANNQNLSLAKKGIGFSVEVLKVKKNSSQEPTGFFETLFFGGVEDPSEIIPLHDYKIVNDSILGCTYGGEDEVSGIPFSYHLVEVAYSISGEIKKSKGQYVFSQIDGKVVRVERPQLVEKVQSQIDVRKYYRSLE